MKTLNLALLTTLGASACLLGGCAADSASNAPASKLAAANVETVRSTLERDEHPTLTDAEQATLAKGQADFAVDILRVVAKDAPNDNVFLSPHSISIALGMTYAGARGETASEMKQALHLDLPDDRVATGFNYLDLELASRGKGAVAKDGKPFRLNVANAMWGQKGSSFEAPFLDTLAVSYGAGVNVVDFVAHTEDARTTINAWVEAKTEDRIKNLIPEGALNDRTRAVLVNAVYFNAAWTNKFTESATAPAPFTKLDGSTIDVPTMHASAAFTYGSADDYEAIALPYDGGELSMLVVVPKAGTYATFEAGISGGKVLGILAGLTSREVNLSFPKLKLDCAFSLKKPLQTLGMKKAFQGGVADFSAMSKSTALVITDVLHKTFLDVDENGTEAAAATGVILGGKSAPVDVVNLKVDRPFITAIVDNKTQTLVFLGRIVEPKN